MTIETHTKCDNCGALKPESRRLCEQPWLRLDSDGIGERDFCTLQCVQKWAALSAPQAWDGTIPHPTPAKPPTGNLGAASSTPDPTEDA